MCWLVDVWRSAATEGNVGWHFSPVSDALKCTIYRSEFEDFVWINAIKLNYLALYLL